MLDDRPAPIAISRTDGRLATFSSPGQPDRPIALRGARPRELLAEELRRLDEDDIYAAVARTLAKDQAVTPPRVEVHDRSEALATAVAGELLARLADAQAAARTPQIGLTGGTIADAIHREVGPALRAAPRSTGRRSSSGGATSGSSPPTPPTATPARPARRSSTSSAPTRHVHEMPSTADAADVAAGAAAYADELRAYGGGEFEVLMLGVGPDGHVASLFPGYPQLDVDDQIAVAVTDSPKPPPERISLDLPGAQPRRGRCGSWSAATARPRPSPAPCADGRRPATTTPAAGVTGREETIWFLDRGRRLPPLAESAQLPSQWRADSAQHVADGS